MEEHALKPQLEIPGLAPVTVITLAFPVSLALFVILIISANL